MCRGKHADTLVPPFRDVLNASSQDSECAANIEMEGTATREKKLNVMLVDQ